MVYSYRLNARTRTAVERPQRTMPYEQDEFYFYGKFFLQYKINAVSKRNLIKIRILLPNLNIQWPNRLESMNLLIFATAGVSAMWRP